MKSDDPLESAGRRLVLPKVRLTLAGSPLTSADGWLDLATIGQRWPEVCWSQPIIGDVWRMSGRTWPRIG